MAIVTANLIPDSPEPHSRRLTTDKLTHAHLRGRHGCLLAKHYDRPICIRPTPSHRPMKPSGDCILLVVPSRLHPLAYRDIE